MNVSAMALPNLRRPNLKGPEPKGPDLHGSGVEVAGAPAAGDGADDWALLSSEAGAAGLETLFERHRDYVYRLAMGFLGGPALAEDATQEVFLRLARGRRPWFPIRAKFTTWLYRTTLNVCREARRRRRREVPLETEGPSPSTSPAEMVVRAPDPALADLLTALDSLPERQREAVVLRHLEGASTREAAALMGCREGSVKTHLHRGLAALRKALGGEPPST